MFGAELVLLFVIVAAAAVIVAAADVLIREGWRWFSRKASKLLSRLRNT